MTDEADLIVQLAPGSAVDRNLRADPPPSVRDGRVVLDHVEAEADGRLGPPEAGEIILSVLSPEALRDPEQIQEVIRRAPAAGQPLVIIVEAAEELREDELAVVADAASGRRPVILRVVSGDA